MPVIVPVIGSGVLIFALLLTGLCFWGLTRSDRKKREKEESEIWLSTIKKR